MHNNQIMGQNYQCRLRHFAELRQYCKQDLCCKIISVSEVVADTDDVDKTEFIFAEISHNADKFLLGTFYNPPRGDCAAKLEEKLFELSLRYQNTVLIGDFNTDFIKPSTKRYRMQGVLDSFGLMCVNNEPRVCVPSVISRSHIHPIREQAIKTPIDSVLFVFMGAHF